MFGFWFYIHQMFAFILEFASTLWRPWIASFVTRGRIFLGKDIKSFSYSFQHKTRFSAKIVAARDSDMNGNV